MTAIGRIVTTVAATPAPAIFLDTCILLDIVRAPYRDKATEVQIAQLLLTSVAKSPKTVHLFVGSPTQTEWNDNIDTVEDECKNAIKSCNAVAAICGHVGMLPPSPLPTGIGALSTQLRQLSADLLAVAVRIDHNAAALKRAVDRVVACKRPARKKSEGKGDGAKDAVIVEHAVEATGQLRTAGGTQPCVFVSSNVRDFAAGASTNLHGDLLPAFTPVQLDYATSLEHTQAILRAGGWTP